ncbi:HTH domain-containing protein [Halogranum amylolyticum]|uniref:HTH domain-containing protein n=1 Tax=Halogranum amylolyticum TaxID=660520 RepID=A0A1H8UXN9_9EURY|nr:HTH domain-containing protein [Halogranum amylolyticum]SEP07929.1 HTH domain-containing protein [Halogranum amylolyticum]
MTRDRDEKGMFTELTTAEAVLKVLETSDDPVMTAKEIADQLEVSRDTVGRKLAQLSEEGKVRQKKVGARAVVWWIED